jgi:hypothetical protein
MNEESKYHDEYYALVLDKKSSGDLIKDKVFLIIDDISDRKGLKQEFGQIDGDIQDEIVEAWIEILKR